MTDHIFTDGNTTVYTADFRPGYRLRRLRYRLAELSASASAFFSFWKRGHSIFAAVALSASAITYV